jgi:hypothetical protein
MRYFNGQFLQETDFQAEQAYHLDRQRRHNRTLHTSGIAQGLDVTANLGANDVQVASGTAIDEDGRMIVLENGSDPLSIRPEHHGKTVLLVISYDDEPSDPATVGGNGATRIHEKPKLEFFVEGADPLPGAGTHIRLARLEITSGGTIGAHHTSVRDGAGVRLGDTLELRGVTLTRGDVDPSQWSTLNLGAARRVDVDGNLRVSGSLEANDLATGLVSHSAIKDHVITISKLSTRRVAEGTRIIAVAATFDVPVSDPIPTTQAPPLTQVFVSAFSRTPNARFSWTQGSRTTGVPTGGTSQQFVFFRNEHTAAIEIQYEIHVWTDDLA